MKIYLHIGVEKTGTTSIQTFLNQNRSKLSEKGICFPKTIGDLNHLKLVAHCEGDSFGKRMYGLVGVANKEEKTRWSKNLLQEFDTEISSLAVKPECLIISSEHFHSNLTCVEELEELKRVLTKYSDDLQIVVYLRRQVDAAISLYSTALRAGGTQEELLNYNGIRSRRYNYKVLLDLWKEVFADSIIPRIYQKSSLLEGDVVKDFCSIIGVKGHWEDFIHPSAQNTSLSVVGQYLLLEANKIVPFSLNARNKRRRLIDYLEENYSGKSCMPEYEDCLRFQEHFEDSNSNVAKEWFNQDTLFSEYGKRAASITFDSISEDTKSSEMSALKEFLLTIY